MEYIELLILVFLCFEHIFPLISYCDWPNFYDSAFSAFLHCAVGTDLLCRVREIIFEKNRETLLFEGYRFLSKVADELFLKLLRLK